MMFLRSSATIATLISCTSVLVSFAALISIRLGLVEPPPSALQASALKAVIVQALNENPNVVADAMKSAARESREAMEQRRSRAISELHRQIETDPADHVLGNPDGDVTLVEFFDYRCTYCKAMAPRLKDLIASDSKIRLVLKQLPILGDNSLLAAKVALASGRQGRFEPVHDALISAKGPLDEALIWHIAADQGIDMDQLKSALDDPELDSIVKGAFPLAKRLEITGTPAFVLGDRVLSGAASEEVLKNAIDVERQKGRQAKLAKAMPDSGRTTTP
jgi:protein-disulfide isomerase